MKKVSLFFTAFTLKLLGIFNLFVRPLLGARGICRFTPTCSQYAKQAVSKYGVCKGLFLTIKRLLKCHPLHAGGYDPVP